MPLWSRVTGVLKVQGSSRGLLADVNRVKTRPNESPGRKRIHEFDETLMNLFSI